MTDNQTPGSASSQLKQLMVERVNQGLGMASKAVGQQAGVLAQSVRQTGEEMRQQGQDSQGMMADRIAHPIQRMSASFSQAQPEASSDVQQLKPKLTQQVKQIKTQAGSRIKGQAQTRTSAAAEGVNAITQGVRQVGEQLRAQGQQTPALFMDAVAEKLEPVAGYLSSTDPDKLRSDISAYRQKAQVKVSSAAETATAKGTQAAKATATRVRSKPALPVAGALSIVALAALRMRKSKAQPQEVPEVPDSQFDRAVMVVEAPAEDLHNLTRAQLRDRAAAAGLDVGPEMTKSELIEALQGR